MNKIILCLTIAASVILFAACNNTSDTEKNNLPDDPAINVSDPIQNQDEVEKLVDSDSHDPESAATVLGMSIIENFSFPEMYILEKDEIKGEYGVNTDNIEDIFAAVPMEYPGIERVFIAKIKDKAVSDTAKEQLATNFDTIKAEYIDYLPEEYKKAKDVEIFNKNDLLVLVISEDYDAIISYINK